MAEGETKTDRESARRSPPSKKRPLRSARTVGSACDRSSAIRWSPRRWGQISAPFSAKGASSVAEAPKRRGEGNPSVARPGGHWMAGQDRFKPLGGNSHTAFEFIKRIPVRTYGVYVDIPRQGEEQLPIDWQCEVGRAHVLDDDRANTAVALGNHRPVCLDRRYAAATEGYHSHRRGQTDADAEHRGGARA